MSELLFDRINGLIAQATFDRDNTRMLTFRMIKAKLLEFKTAKNAKPLDAAAEIQILKKMVKQREDSAKMYEEANRLELAANEKAEISILLEFIPENVSEEEIIAYVIDVLADPENSAYIQPIKSNMGNYMKAIKAKYPTADGKLVSDIVKSRLV